ncbi:MAG: FTR1 family protein [Actinobacteria bacterium]|nr:FTR1 family protein [Actinomycetota bacterium]
MADEIFCDDVKRRRFNQAWGIWIFAGAILAALVGGVVYASQGPADPTQATQATSHAVVVANSAVIVFREGLEAVLIFAAVTASMLGAQRNLRRPVALGAGVAFAATVATWFIAQAILSQFSQYGDKLQAVTGLLAIAVLLVIMNWFFHKVYWTKWIGKRNAQRKRVLARGAEAGVLSAQVIGLVALGFSSVYREGFEVVLFLQNLQLQAGTTTVLEGVAIGLAATVAVGIATFFLQQKLPYKRMLVVTGVMLGVVLVVMVGGSARTLQDVGWLSSTNLGVRFPGWWARWFELVPTWETVGAQLFAGFAVVGSYFVAQWLKVRRPRARGAAIASRPLAPPLAD